MTDMIYRQAAIWAVRKAKDKSEAHRMLIQLPNSDAVPVVRCRDCTHYNAGYECLIEGYGVERDPEWFCGDGERKDDDNGTD